jgi:peptide/nickel transport system permease protein
MVQFLFSRLLQAVMLVFIMACLTFVGVYALGNPIDILISPQADEIERAAAIARLGLDKPFVTQFFTFLGNALQGNLGKSFVHGTDAVELILAKMPATLELTLFAFVITLSLGLPLGIYAGYRPFSLGGRLIKTLSIVGISLPNFWFGILLILLFSVTLRWLPAGGRGEVTAFLGLKFSFLSLEGLKHIILPATTLAVYKTALIIRLTMSGTREALNADYVRFARAKGLSEARILRVHVLKNILLPLITVLGLELGAMIAFAVVTEKVFAWPGMGKLLIDSIFNLDRPVIVAYLLIIVVMFVTLNLLVDMLYALLDPRVRVKAASK